MGMRVDYLSPTLYLTDIAWSLWIATKIINLKFDIFKPKEGIASSFLPHNDAFFGNLLIALFVVVNVLVAGNKWAAVYRWLRIGQWILTVFSLQLRVDSLKKYLRQIVPWWIILESLLAAAQMVKGGALQGIFYWLGERQFTIETAGVAQMSILGEGLIRAYGTFSHPNSLGGFLLVSLLVWFKYGKSYQLSVTSFQLKKVWFWMVTWLAVVGIFLTGSRVVIALMLLQFLIFNFQFLIKKENWKYGVGILLVGGGLGALMLGMIGKNYQIGDFVGGWDRESWTKRMYLNRAAIKMWRENLMIGVGAGNFLVKLPEYQEWSRIYWLQPVHNIFLLLGSELGVIGIIGGIWVIVKAKFEIFNLKFKKKWNKNLLIWGVILVTGMMDHYWVTLPQNTWLLAVVMGMI